MLNIRDFFQLWGSTEDAAPAFNAALAKAIPRAESIILPAANYYVRSDFNEIPVGLWVRGEGGPNSAELGTNIYDLRPNCPPGRALFNWTGTDPRTNRGTGGGAEGFTVNRYFGIGGTCIRVAVTKVPDFRAGDFTLRDCSLISTHQGLYDYILDFDGSAVPAGYRGGIGARQFHLSNFILSGAMLCTWRNLNVCHLEAFGGQVQRGPVLDINPPVPPACLRISGVDSSDHHYFGVSVQGLLHIEQCREFTFRGKAAQVRIDADAKRGLVDLVGCDQLVRRSDASVKITSV